MKLAQRNQKLEQTGKPLRSQSGQVLVEYVLLLALVISLSLFITNYLQQNQFVQNLIAAPWDRLSGMVECGSWQPCRPGLHPSARIISWRVLD